MLRHYPKPNEKEISWHLLAGIFTLLKLASYLRLVLLQKPYLQAKQKQNLFFFYLLTIWGSFLVTLLFQANIAARFAAHLSASRCYLEKNATIQSTYSEQPHRCYSRDLFQMVLGTGILLGLGHQQEGFKYRIILTWVVLFHDTHQSTIHNPMMQLIQINSMIP